jgi:hypothetical protein
MPYTTEERIAAKKLAQEKYRNANKQKVAESMFNSRLKNKYNITRDDYNEMLFNQKGCCAICDKHHTEHRRALSVDHCHTTGKVRGLLCDECNHMLGKVKDNITILKNAIKYLKQHGI